MLREEELRCPRPDGSLYRYPRVWLRIDRRLLEVVETIRVDTPADLLGLLPSDLPTPFTSADIAVASRRPKHLAMRAAYCLQRAGVARCIGRRGRAQMYEVVPSGGQ